MRELFNDKRVLAILFGVFLIVVGSQVFAQDAVDVQQDINIADVDSKANQNSTKVVGVESRVTQLETTGTTVEDRIATLEARPTIDPTIEARVAALEANPGGVTQADHDALAARVTALESPTAGGVFALYDASGARLGEWQSRTNFGRALINVGGFEVFAQFDRDAISYLGLVAPLDLLFLDKFCLTTPVVSVDDVAGLSGPYVPLVERSTEFFGGKIHATVRGGIVFAVDTTISHDANQGRAYRLDDRNRCQDTGKTFPNQAMVYHFSNLGALPTFYPPFSMVQE